MSTDAHATKSRQAFNCAAQSAHPPESLPLSYGQEGLWILEQITPGTPAHNLAEAWQLKGQLDVRSLRRSLEQIVQRQEALRTSFSQHDGKPMQVVHPTASLPGPLMDLSQRSDKHSLLQRWLATEAGRPFDLNRAPLVRVGLFRLEPQEHVLFINMHHLISDAWSQGVFMRELAEFYSAAVRSTEPALQELPIQYADYVLWQRQRMEGSVLEEQIAYWQQQLRGTGEPLLLATDHPRPAQQSYRGATQFSALPKELVYGLKELCRKEGCTLFMVLLAAFKTFLHRYTRQEDILVGAPMAGRERLETEGLIGFFVNTLALRTNLSGDPRFIELLARVRETVLGANGHQGIPWEKLMKALQPQRDLSRHPLFPVVFGLQSSLAETWHLEGLESRRLELDNGAAKFDWTLLLTEREEECHLRSEFSTELFEPGTMLRWVHQLEVLLESIIAAPHQRLSELRLLTQPERDQLLLNWNQAPLAEEPCKCIHELFEAEAAMRPDTVALTCQSKQLTYGELNRRANQLARRLVRAGVGPDLLVGVCMERSLELVIAMLAILKAGGAYVPLDPHYPQERLQFILRDAGIKVLVTGHPLKAIFGAEQEVICVDLKALPLAKEEGNDLPNRSTSENLAYALYTSGSTGTPKAVAVPHRAVVRLVRKPNYIDISSQDVFLQLAPASFDASTFEIWGALLNGAKLVIFPPYFPSLEELGRAIREERVTILWLTAGLFHQMIDFNLPSLSGLRFLLAGGEALSVTHVLRAASNLTTCQIINGYGPTENTTFSCCYHVPAAWAGGSSVPIGRPINGTEVYILDGCLQPVPVGAPGELYVGGDGLARGYVNRPELTSEKFIVNPFASSGRLYRTGDLVRWLPEGEIEFLGRIDQQVKIRGFRVEPAEVELALVQHPEVSEGLVVARPDKSGTNQLVAYVVPQLEKSIPSEELRRFLGGKLPQFLIPSHFVFLKALPLNANGKVDRRALPEPQLNWSDEPGEGQPASAIEQLVAGIWRELLGCKAIGRHQNLFHMGCHSLLATQAISRMAKILGVELPVRAIFESPTVAGLAQRVQSQQPGAQAAGTGPTPGTPQLQPAKGPKAVQDFGNTTEEPWLATAELDTALR